MNLTKMKELTDELKLVSVVYGEDQGLVSIQRGLALFKTWDTTNCCAMHGVPVVQFADWEIHDIFGEEHSWDDVIRVLQDHYDWKSKSIPDMDVIAEFYKQEV